MVAVHEWLSDIKALPGTNSHFLARVLWLHLLALDMPLMVFLIFFK
jgi:hypothetical protein